MSCEDSKCTGADMMAPLLHSQAWYESFLKVLIFVYAVRLFCFHLYKRYKGFQNEFSENLVWNISSVKEREFRIYAIFSQLILSSIFNRTRSKLAVGVKAVPSWFSLYLHYKRVGFNHSYVFYCILFACLSVLLVLLRNVTRTLKSIVCDGVCCF